MNLPLKLSRDAGLAIHDGPVTLYAELGTDIHTILSHVDRLRFALERLHPDWGRDDSDRFFPQIVPELPERTGGKG
jgi:hypothetical protein